MTTNLTIDHPQFGHGEVLRSVHQGFYWQVRFASGVRSIRADALEPHIVVQLANHVAQHTKETSDGQRQSEQPQEEQTGDTTSSTTSTSRATSTSETTSAATSNVVSNVTPNVGTTSNNGLRPDFYARSLIEALRMGIVPQGHAHAFTFGQVQARHTIDAWLARKGDGAMVLVGGYGTGKTHLLHYLQADALAQGYAVASVAIDLFEVPFHQPKRVYAALAEHFRYRTPGAATNDLQHFLLTARERRALRKHPFFHLLEDTSDLAQQDILDWLLAKTDASRPEGARALPDTATAANVYTYLLTSLAYLAKYVFGLEGMVLFVDEVEALDAGYVNAYQDDKSANFLRALLQVSGGGSKLAPHWHSEPANAPLTSSGHHQDIPFSFGNPSHLRTMLALTPTPMLEQVDVLQDATKVWLEPLDSDALHDMYASIYDHYLRAYPPSRDHWHTQKAKTKNLDLIANVVRAYTETTRRVVKGAVEHLDVTRHFEGKNY